MTYQDIAGLALTFIGTLICAALITLAFMEAKQIDRRRNFRRVIVRARGIDTVSNKIGEN